MIDGGEDILFIARRMVIFASEDIGNADPRALQVAVNVMHATEKIGLPEARIILAQGVTYLASTLKSNACYQAINKAQEFVQKIPKTEVPPQLRSGHRKKGIYKYPHDYPGHFVRENYTTTKIPKFYNPDGVGSEKFFKERLSELWKN